MDIALQIKHFFEPYFDAPPQAWENFANYLSPTRFSKNENIKFSGAIEHHLHFIQQGSVGVFLHTDNHDICVDVAFDREFVSDYMSLLLQQPTPLFTKALEDTTALSINHLDLQKLYSTPLGINIKNVVAESLFIHKQHQQIELLSMTAEQRYRKLLAENPRFVLNIAQIHLASYLGVTPESLSRIRKKNS